MTNPNQDISSTYIEKFKKLRYFVEGGKHEAFVFYILGGVIFLLALIFGILLMVQQVDEAYILIMVGAVVGLITAGYGFFYQRKKSYKLYKDVHKRIMDQGVMYIGVVTEMNLRGTLSHHVADAVEFFQNGVVGNSTEHFYTYIVQYTDAYHNQKTTETYEIANYSAKDVGKRCTVYEHDGKVIVDAVER